MSLPENLAPVLCDGVVLCHLANHVRPRSVASVHVPSPAQVLAVTQCDTFNVRYVVRTILAYANATLEDFVVVFENARRCGISDVLEDAIP